MVPAAQERVLPCRTEVMLRMPHWVLFFADKLPNTQRVPTSCQPGLECDGEVLLKSLHPGPALRMVPLTVVKALEASLPLFAFCWITLMSFTKVPWKSEQEHPSLLSLNYMSCYCQATGQVNTAGVGSPGCTISLWRHRLPEEEVSTALDGSVLYICPQAAEQGSWCQLQSLRTLIAPAAVPEEQRCQIWQLHLGFVSGAPDHHKKQS